MNKPKSKIAIISQSLGGGGAERAAGLLSIMLDNLGFEIHHIIIEDLVDYDYNGVVFSLEKNANGSRFQKKIRKSLLMRNYLSDQKIDIIIENRPRNLFFRDFISKIIFGSRKKYYIIHSYKLENYLPNSASLAKLLYGNAEKLICVSQAIAEKVKITYDLQNTVAIYNPVDMSNVSIVKPTDVPEKYILFFGRLQEKVKNFTLMLEAFALSGVQKSGLKLVILGDGPDRNFIEKKISELQLTDSVVLLPFRKNPYDYVAYAKFSILTSYYEGFPMSVIESLALKTPVVSVDCHSGPSEIIVNEYNGLLVPNHDVNALAQAIARFAEDQNLYDICKNNAGKSVAHLSPEMIAKQWSQILPQQ